MQKTFLLLLMLLPLLPCHAAQRVEVFFNVPPGLETYSGLQPVTFGVPFPEGVLSAGNGVRLIDAKRKVLPAQFEVTAHWKPDKKNVRWLLVDCFADIRNGKAQRAWLEFGKGVKPIKSTPMLIDQSPTANGRFISVMGGEYYFDRENNDIGDFVLRDGTGKEYSTGGKDSQWNIEVEKNGTVRSVVKMTGRYVAADGTSIAAFTTRVRLYKDCRFVRVYHTLNWLTDDYTTIADLSLRLADRNFGKTRLGVDGRRFTDSKSTLLRQTDWNRVLGSASGQQLDGWMQRGEKNRSLFAGLRWAWQQYPIGFATDGSTSIIKLIAPQKPMNLKPLDVAVPSVLHNVPSWNLRIFKGGLPMHDVIYNGPPALLHLSPRGISKTWEILLWRGGQESPEIKNIFAQHPVLAYADPAFATRAALPSPSSPYNIRKFPEIENALQRAFGWYTRELSTEGDFGTWNYGDLQWDWTESGHPIYRYWMNAGKGWSILPWALWLRSGDRRYWENGEANSRHVMDVDTCHIPEWERDPNDFKLRGGQYHYSALHWGYGPEVVTYYVDSEYLPYYYYMTGYERAKDALLDHAEAVARFPLWNEYVKHFEENLPERASRHLYVMVKNLAVLYEATWDPRLKKALDEYTRLTLEAQLPSGNFPGVKTNHYLDEPLNIAARVYGWERVAKPLQRWQEMMGDPLRPGTTGNVRGPLSLWTAVNLYQHTGDAHHLKIAEQVMRAQATTVEDGTTIWRGLNAIPGHEAGPMLRDWIIALSALSSTPPAMSKAAREQLPLAGFHSMLPVSNERKKQGWGPRHVALILNPTGENFSLELAFLQQPTKRYRLRLLAPDGTVLRDEMRDYEYLNATVAAYESKPTRETVAGGQKGVYVLELSAQTARDDFITPLTVKSTTGKVVHLMPPGRRNFSAGLDAGRFWFQPIAGEEVVFGLSLGQSYKGRTVMYDADGRIVAQSAITGTREVALPKTPPAAYACGLPEGEPCHFKAPPDAHGLYSCTLPVEEKWNRWIEIKGLRPYVSATREEWFDPELHPHPDLKALETSQ